MVGDGEMLRIFCVVISVSGVTDYIPRPIMRPGSPLIGQLPHILASYWSSHGPDNVQIFSKKLFLRSKEEQSAFYFPSPPSQDPEYSYLTLPQITVYVWHYLVSFFACRFVNEAGKIG